MPHLYYLEGNIGSGKTTLLHAIENYINDKKIIDIQVVYEPVKIWREIGLLDSFYRDPKRWSYTFQNIAFITKMMELDKLKDDIIYIIERSPMTDKNCFAQLCFENGFMSNMEWELYNLWYDHYLPKYSTPKGYIYLKSNPITCLERINMRKRDEESTISIEYLEKLNTKHKKWLFSRSDTLEINDFNLDLIDNTIETIFNFILQ